MSLHLVQPARKHDLPPRWDDTPVAWSSWNQTRTTLAYHLPAQDLACTECGAVDERSIAFGARKPEEDYIDAATRDRPHATVRAYPIRDLVAYRCRHCGHDQVWDQRTNTTWDLDPDDYGPEGSTERKDTLW